MDGFAGANACQIAIALIGEHQAVGPKALAGCGQCRCTTMCSFLPIDVNVAISKDTTSHRADADGVVLHAHLFYHFGYELVYYAVGATGAVVHRHVIEEFWLLIDQILRLDNLFFCHDVL